MLAGISRQAKHYTICTCMRKVIFPLNTSSYKNLIKICCVFPLKCKFFCFAQCCSVQIVPAQKARVFESFCKHIVSHVTPWANFISFFVVNFYIKDVDKLLDS